MQDQKLHAQLPGEGQQVTPIRTLLSLSTAFRALFSRLLPARLMGVGGRVVVPVALVVALVAAVGSFAYFTSPGSGTGTANAGSFTGPLDHFLVEATGGGNIGAQSTGTPFSVKITAQDASNHTVTSFTGTVDVTSNRTCSVGCAQTAAFTAGVLSSHSITLTQAGTLSTITATDHSGTGKTGTSNTFTVIASDSTAPYVTAINRADANPTNAGTLHWTVSFSESVTGVDSTDFSLVPTGVTGTSITAVTGSGSGPYTVTVNSGSGNGTLGVNLVDDNSIKDGANNPLGDSVGGANGNFSGQAYTIDKTSPSVTSINRADASPTNSSTVHWTVTFSESVSGVDATDFALVRTGIAGGSITGVSGSGSGPYTVTATTGTGDGSFGLNLVDDDSITDAAGNKLGGTGTIGAGDGSFTGQTYTIDKTGPAVTVEQKVGQADPTNTLPILWTVTFSEAVSGFDATDLSRGGTASGGTVSVIGSGASYEISVGGSPTNGSISFTIAASKAQDTAGNANAASTSSDNTVSYDTITPTVTINQAAGQSDPTGVTPIDFTGVFSESVTGFATGDVTLGGTAGATTATVTGSGTTYNVAVSGMTVSGTVSATIAVAKATDAAGNANNASTSTDNTVTYDTTPFVLSIERAGASPTNAASVTWTVTFTRPVTGVDTTDFALATTGLGGTPAITGVSGSGAVYTVTATSGTGSGSLGLNLVDDNTIRDAAVNGSKLGGNSMGDGNFTGQVYAIDRTAPTVTVNQKSGQADPTNTLPILFTVTFSESVTGFDATDLTRGGTSTGGTVSVTGSGASYEIAVTNPGATLTNGTVSFTIAAARAQDTAGNNNTASSSTDNTVTYDTVGPTVTINQAGAQADPTNASTINFTVVFSDSVTGFTGSDVSLSGSAGATTATVTGSGTTYNVAVSGMTSSGSVSASVAAAAVSDAAGNTSVASTSSDNTVAYDNVAPTVTINQAAGQNDPTNASPIDFTVVFSESVTGFTTGDVTLAGTTGATTATVTGSGTTYNVAVTGMTTAGTVSATIGAARATDAAGNNNLASSSTDNTVSYDNVAPTVTINQAAGQSDPTNVSSINFAVIFSESVTGFATGDVTLAGTSGATTATVTGSGTTYNVAVAGMTTGGTVVATIAAGKATDAAGNGNLASTSTDNTITYDQTAPTVVSITRAGASATVNSGPLTWTVTFSEPVNGVTTSNFGLATSGLGGTAPSITSATASGGAPSATWTVSASTTGTTGTNSGSIGLNLANVTNIKDVATNSLSATTPVVGEAYTYDTTAPTVTVNQAATQSDPTNAAHVNFTVTFSEAVTGFSSANISLGGTAGATSVVVTGSGSTYNVSVGGMTSSGTVTASVTAASAQDAAGNQAQASTSSDNSIQFTATITITSPPENQSGFSRTGPFTGSLAPNNSTVTIEFCQAATFTSACEATPSASFTTTANVSGGWTLTLTAGQQLNNNASYSMRATATTGTTSSVVRHFHT
jgi:hypothetical protein